MKKMIAAAVSLSLFASIVAPSFAHASACTELKADAKELRVKLQQLEKAGKALDATTKALKVAEENRDGATYGGIALTVIVAGYGAIKALIKAFVYEPSSASSGQILKNTAIVGTVVAVGTTVSIYYTSKEAEKQKVLFEEASKNQKELSLSYNAQRDILIASWANNRCVGSPF